MAVIREEKGKKGERNLSLHAKRKKRKGGEDREGEKKPGNKQQTEEGERGDSVLHIGSMEGKKKRGRAKGKERGEYACLSSREGKRRRGLLFFCSGGKRENKRFCRLGPWEGKKKKKSARDSVSHYCREKRKKGKKKKPKKGGEEKSREEKKKKARRTSSLKKEEKRGRLNKL